VCSYNNKKIELQLTVTNHYIQQETVINLGAKKKVEELLFHTWEMQQVGTH